MSVKNYIAQAVETIKTAILQSQYGSAKLVNMGQLSLYFGIGRYISENSRKGYWGTGAIDQISDRLQKDLPGLRGFSATSIKKMRQFYEQWNSILFRPLSAVEISLLSSKVQHYALDISQINEFVSIGFTHHIEMFKDEYLLDYINVEQLGERDAADVDELKKGDFKPAYLGQLSAYLRVLDTEVKKPFENPSIGIILCQNADKSFVEFLIQGYKNPKGVATYKTQEDIRRVLPKEEDLLKLLKDSDNENLGCAE